jgi:hypothetical protein
MVAQRVESSHGPSGGGINGSRGPHFPPDQSRVSHLLGTVWRPDQAADDGHPAEGSRHAAGNVRFEQSRMDQIGPTAVHQ